MTTHSQLNGGTVKHIDPSNYSTGKSGTEATIHYSIRDGAPLDEQQKIGDLARGEAIRLALGIDRPYTPEAAPVPFVPPVLTTAATPAPVESPVQAAGVVGASSAPAAAISVIDPAPGLTAQPGPIAMPAASPSEPVPSQPVATPSAISAPVAAGPATPASTSTVIEDKAMLDAASHTQARILKAAAQDAISQEMTARKIEGVIRQFVPPGTRLFDIPQEKRQAFLDALDAL